jgi:hypothetical protein
MKQRCIMAEYDLFIPLVADTGKQFPRRGLNALKQKLAKRFGGLTYFPHKNEGVWKIGSATFRDRIVILRVLTDDSRKSKSYLQSLKQEIAREWKQKDVLIVKRRVWTL